MSEQDQQNREEYQYNDEMTIVQNFFQKHAGAAEFIRSTFPDQMDPLEDEDPSSFLTPPDGVDTSDGADAFESFESFEVLEPVEEESFVAVDDEQNVYVKNESVTVLAAEDEDDK